MQTAQEMQATAEAVSAVSDELDGLDRRSREIGAIVAAIKQIAEQTNLLALNAAIEAARAGESMAQVCSTGLQVITVVDVIAQAAAASKESGAPIVRHVEAIADLAQENFGAVQASSVAVADLKTMANELPAAVGVFRR